LKSPSPNSEPEILKDEAPVKSKKARPTGQIQKRSGHFESFDGTKIYYEDRGEGRPVVLAYGIACGMNHWRHQIRYFSQNYRCITLDYRGHNRSGTPKNRDNLTIDALARDMEVMNKTLGIEKATYMGHSFGAQVLIRAYDMYPQMFDGLVFINGFATNPIQGMFGVDAVSDAFKFLKKGYEQMPETISYLWRSIVTNPVSMRLTGMAGGFNLDLTSFKDIEIYARGVAALEVDVFLQLFEQMINYDGRPVLERIAIPSLIISGANDSVTSLRYQKTLNSLIKGSELQLVPYGSHCTQLDMPDLVNLRIEKFLKAL
jgi:pimeloyl-ACP methyl ester carboxylesterase